MLSAVQEAVEEDEEDGSARGRASTGTTEASAASGKQSVLSEASSSSGPPPSVSADRRHIRMRRVRRGARGSVTQPLLGDDGRSAGGDAKV